MLHLKDDRATLRHIPTIDATVGPFGERLETNPKDAADQVTG